MVHFYGRGQLGRAPQWNWKRVQLLSVMLVFVGVIWKKMKVGFIFNICDLVDLWCSISSLSSLYCLFYSCCTVKLLLYTTLRCLNLVSTKFGIFYIHEISAYKI